MTDTADHRPDIYRDGPLRVFRASSFGGCDGNLVRAAVGMQPAAKPEWLADAMANSAGHEATVIQALGRYGWNALDVDRLGQYGKISPHNLQLEAELKVAGSMGGVVRCHPDGVVSCWKAKLSDSWAVKDRAVLEVKVMKGPRRDVLADSEWYRWQTSIEMAVTGLPLLWVVAWKDGDGGLEVDAEGRPDLTVAYIPEPFYTVQEIRQRVRHLNRLIDDYDDGKGLPACTWKQYPCPYYSTHDTTKGLWMDETVKVEGAARVKLRRMAKKFAELKAIEEVAKAERADVNEAMVKLCADNGLEGKLDVGEGLKVERVIQGGRKKFVKARAIEKFGAGIEDCYEVGAGSDYMKVAD